MPQYGYTYDPPLPTENHAAGFRPGERFHFPLPKFLDSFLDFGAPRRLSVPISVGIEAFNKASSHITSFVFGELQPCLQYLGSFIGHRSSLFLTSI